MHPMSEAREDFRERQVVRAANPPGSETLTWLKRVAYHLTGRAVHRTGAVPAGDAHWWHVSTFERAIVTDMSEQGFRVRTRDRQRALELARRGALLLRRLVRDGPSAAARYRAEVARLSSRDNWERLYGLKD
jgi:galactofuranosylgalactofuranosylrhamnosyl-N-acetylglucosaminyl-diphospho-decaprenol beta-1,5/1,6-galactofuranosyltransferase